MPRQLKPYKVDVVTSSDGYTHLDVMLDRNNKKFFVEVVPGDPESRVEAASVHEVKKLAREELDTLKRYEWTPLIVVAASEPNRWDSSRSLQFAGVEFKFRRFERSPHPSREGLFVERMHPLLAEELGIDVDRQSVSSCDDREPPGTTTGKPGAREVEATLPYDQATWDALVVIRDGIEKARASLEALLSRRDVGSLLKKIAPAPEFLALPPAPGRRAKGARR